MRKCKGQQGLLKELAERAEQRVLRWFGHVEKMKEERLVKKITRSDVRGIRPRGRPRMRWLNSVRRALGARVDVCGASKSACA